MDKETEILLYLDKYYIYLHNNQLINILIALQDIKEENDVQINYIELLVKIDKSFRRKSIILEKDFPYSKSIISSTKILFNLLDKDKKGYLLPKDILQLYELQIKSKLIISDNQISDLISALYRDSVLEFEIFMSIINQD